MTFRLLTLTALLVGTAVAAPLPFPKAVKKRALPLPDALQGLWEVKSRTGPGGVRFAVSTVQKYVKIEGTTWTYLRDDKVTPGTKCEMTLDPNHKPAHLDLGYPTTARVAAAGALAARLVLEGPYMSGIVELDGDTMKYCYALRSDRPTSFTPTNPREYLITLERVVEKPVKKR
jgi:uncharacterized protein (TIGR03067 family)